MLPDWLPAFDFTEQVAQLGIMAWPLAACSIVALAIGIERLVFVLKATRAANARYARLAEYLREIKVQPKPVRDEMVGVMLNDLQRPYYSGIKSLRLIGMISPIFGLLGTILGIIAAFKVISVQTGPVSPALIADGLWEAMLTTAVGLLIALPALLMAHFFSSFSERQLGRFCLDLNRLSLSFELAKTESKSEIVEFASEVRRK